MRAQNSPSYNLQEFNCPSILEEYFHFPHNLFFIGWDFNRVRRCKVILMYVLVTSITSKVRRAPILELGQALEGTKECRCWRCRFQNAKFKIPILELKKHKVIHLKFGNRHSKEIQKTPTHNKCYQTTIEMAFNTNYTLNMVNIVKDMRNVLTH